jgi:hypothetical protein
MAARQRPGFTDMVHDIWAHLQGGRR